MFKVLVTELLVSTAYHLQTDGRSERTNQTIEIALRYHIATSPDEPWDEFVTYLKGSLNNSTTASTGFLPNEMCYGMKLSNGSNVLDDGAGHHADLCSWDEIHCSYGNN